jgi:hypothetical protein
MAIHDSLIVIFDFPVFWENRKIGFEEKTIFIGLPVNRP